MTTAQTDPMRRAVARLRAKARRLVLRAVERGESPTALAARWGVTAASVYGWVRTGRRPHRSAATRIVAAEEVRDV